MAKCLGCGLYSTSDVPLGICVDSNRGIDCDPAANGGEGCLYVKVDGTSITYNGSGQLQAMIPDACALGVPHFAFASGQDGSGYHTGETPSPGDSVKSFCTSITNNDPCVRSATVVSHIDWSGFAFDAPLAGKYV